MENNLGKNLLREDLGAFSILGALALSAVLISLLGPVDHQLALDTPADTALSQGASHSDHELEILQAHINEVARQSAALEPMAPPRFKPSLNFLAQSSQDRSTSWVIASRGLFISQSLEIGEFAITPEQKSARLRPMSWGDTFQMQDKLRFGGVERIRPPALQFDLAL